MTRNQALVRFLCALLPLLFFAIVLFRVVSAAAPNSSIQVKLDTSKATPRQVEDQTQQVIARDYGDAWKHLEQALEKNRADLLAADFAGAALERWGSTVREQGKTGMSQRLVDRGHHLEVLFYSVEGSAMELRDTAHFQVQYLDGGKVLHSEQLTAHYMVLMTPAESSWKIRVLQEIPSETLPASAELRHAGEGTPSK
jgi:hypothetical protein